MTDFPAIRYILDYSTSRDTNYARIKAAYAELKRAEAAAHMEQVNEYNANRWMVAAEDLAAENQRLRGVLLDISGYENWQKSPTPQEMARSVLVAVGTRVEGPPKPEQSVGS